MSNKRPVVDLAALTAEAATPMVEAQQRAPHTVSAKTEGMAPAVRTENLEALAFKVSPAFRKRFRQCAINADLKLNQLLFEALGPVDGFDQD